MQTDSMTQSILNLSFLQCETQQTRFVHRVALPIPEGGQFSINDSKADGYTVLLLINSIAFGGEKSQIRPVVFVVQDPMFGNNLPTIIPKIFLNPSPSSGARATS